MDRPRPAPDPTPTAITRPAPPSWVVRLARQWRHRQLLKLAGICAFTALFFVGYFHLLRNPPSPPRPVPLMPLDHWFGYQPLAVWPYVSLWIYVGVAPALLPSAGALLRYGAWMAALCGCGLALFAAWPTALPPGWAPQPTPGQAAEALLRGLDAPGNACPSMHVACALFSALWVHRLLAAFCAPAWPRALNAAWLTAIVWSTLALRQHVVLDVLAGAALGLAFGLAALRWGPRPTEPAPAGGWPAADGRRL
ncbi:MAG: phosphatase PAP2 family protein [Rubrivivax sp.]